MTTTSMLFVTGSSILLKKKRFSFCREPFTLKGIARSGVSPWIA